MPALQCSAGACWSVALGSICLAALEERSGVCVNGHNPGPSVGLSFNFSMLYWMYKILNTFTPMYLNAM